MVNRIAVCVPTCGGQYLDYCIESLARSGNIKFDLVVVFNGDYNNFEKFIFPEDATFNLEVLHIPQSGVVHVRNFFFEYCFTKKKYDHLIMLDDDQYVEVDWFENISRLLFSQEFDIVGSYVKPYFHKCRMQSWMSELNVYYLNNRQTGVVDIIHGTGGTGFSRNVASLMKGDLFDPLFAVTGGEDSDFFIRAKSRGAKFYRVKDAVCFETINLERSSLLWAKKRYFRIGFCDAKLNKKYSKSFNFTILSFLSLFIYLPFAMFYPKKEKRIKYICLLHRQLGKIAHLLGIEKTFY